MKTIIPKSFDDFLLKKVIFHKNKVEVYAEIKAVRDGKSVLDNLHYTKQVAPHEDLLNLKNSLKSFLLKAYGVDQAYDKAISYASPSKKENIENSRLDDYNSTEVTRVSFSGEDQLKGLVISGKRDSFYSSKVAMNTPRIVFSSEIMGFEQEVEALAEAIEKEVYEMLLNGKSAIAELPFEEDEEKPKQEAEAVPAE